ncbi:MAG: carbohydrate kinase family protein [Candidatus Pacebacteria bacterium]|nr:carbohydrate kinase family protein [Candidatus Paceibacterota bacterium]
MFDVITFGSATYDLFMASDKLVAIDDEKFATKKGLCVPLGSKIHIDSVFASMGGCGTNAACTFSEQGLKTAYFGSVGKDVFAEAVKKELSRHGVSLELLEETDKYPTAFSVVLSLPNVDRSILEKYGACHELTKEDIPFEKLGAKWFYVSSLSANSHEMLVPLMEFAEKSGIKVASNPAGSLKNEKDTEILKTVLDKIDILILNQEESAELAGVDYKDEKGIFKKLDEMVKGIAVMTKGPDGVVVSDGKDLYSAGIPESEMVDRTGAGDSFGSAFVSGFIENGSIEYAIQLGTANATSNMQDFGATTGLLKKGEWGIWPKVEVKKIPL